MIWNIYGKCAIYMWKHMDKRCLLIMFYNRERYRTYEKSWGIRYRIYRYKWVSNMGNLRTKWAGNGKIINQWQDILVVMFDYQRVALYHLFASATKNSWIMMTA